MKIMLVMLKTMGDVLLATTICRELKRDHPEAEMYFYTNKPYDGLLLNNPDIAEIKVSEQWLPDMLFMEIARGDYDKVYLPYQVRAECNMWHQQEAHRHQHLVDFYWRRMGQHRPIAERECYVFPRQEDFSNAQRYISFDVPRIAVHSTSGVPTKDWPYFEELVEEFRKAGYGCVQVGGRDDKKVKGAIDLRAKMGFLELAAFLSQCALFVGLDSGVSYLADAVKAPTIVIQGSTDPVTSGPISQRVIHLFAKETGYADCQEIRCHVNCRHEVNCNTKITVDMVLTEAEKVLSRWNSPVPAGV